MTRPFVAVAALLLPGCMSMGFQDMSAAQIRATNGVAGCVTVSTMNGRGSSITVNADDIRRGATAKGKTSIQCGDAQMVIEHDVGVAPAK